MAAVPPEAADEVAVPPEVTVDAAEPYSLERKRRRRKKASSIPQSLEAVQEPAASLEAVPEPPKILALPALPKLLALTNPDTLVTFRDQFGIYQTN